MRMTLIVVPSIISTPLGRSVERAGSVLKLHFSVVILVELVEPRYCGPYLTGKTLSTFTEPGCRKSNCADDDRTFAVDLNQRLEFEGNGSVIMKDGKPAGNDASGKALRSELGQGRLWPAGGWHRRSTPSSGNTRAFWNLRFRANNRLVHRNKQRRYSIT
jgi:hypothetical protein